MAVSDPLVMPMVRELLACYEIELAKMETPPGSIGVRPGTVVDFLLSMSDDECCNGLAWIRPETFFPTTGPFPTQATVAQKQGTLSWAVTLELGYVQCAPTPDETEIPSNDEWLDVTQSVMDAGAAMRRALCCFIAAQPMRAQRVLAGQWRPIAVQGGCVGGAIPITIMGPACDCDDAGDSSS